MSSTTAAIAAAEGWIFDAYPKGDKMILWIKQKDEDGSAIRLEDDWSHSIYLAANDRQDLISIVKDHFVNSSIKSADFVKKREKITDTIESEEVLKLTLSDSTQAPLLAKHIMLSGRFGQFRLYNVDILPAQQYFYEHDLFPLAFCKVKSAAAGSGSSNIDSSGSNRLNWVCKDDDVWSLDYHLPEFKTIHLNVNIRKEGKLARFNDKIESISINLACANTAGGTNCHDGQGQIPRRTFCIESKDDESELLLRLTGEIARIDPDFVFTDGGDSFGFPYLAYRAKVNNCSSALVLGREPARALRQHAKEGTTYFSYGKIHYRPTSAQLYGRVHIDTDNSFIMGESGLQGLYEISRICRMPLHKASRASIGRCMSSLQCYYANLDNILVPWKPSFAEHFKTFSDLFIADRGGMIFEPVVEVYEQVAEFDFASLYPSIMSQKNLSGETVLCSCCCRRPASSNSSSTSSNTYKDSKQHIVPELGWHICEKREGIVPQSLKILLTKRAQYKQLMKASETNKKLRQIYSARQGALKWILVTSFGYLGYSNSKFGNIDAHIATCAFDRQILLQSVKIAEAHGFRVLHGIVDSLWVFKNGATRKDYLNLKDAIEQAITGFTISFEGAYKWIAFVHSKDNEQVPVPNRYFGVFEDGSLKIRGIEARRHDTPIFFAKCQHEILKLMATGNTIKEVKALMPQVKEKIYDRYVQILKDGKAPIEELVFTRKISKDSKDYITNTLERSALRQLEEEGKSLRGGEALQYIITDYYSSSNKNKRLRKRRAVPIELVDDKTCYDVRRYVELLAAACNSVTEPFGYVLMSCNDCNTITAYRKDAAAI